jgi:hypothetical protein
MRYMFRMIGAAVVMELPFRSEAREIEGTVAPLPVEAQPGTRALSA